jgi:PAS domain S-box-containing protein
MPPSRKDKRLDLAVDASMQAMFDGMLEGVQLVDKDFRYRYVNAAAAQHGQRRPEELVGKRMPDMYPGIEKTDVFRLIGACIESGEPKGMLNEFTFPDGSSGWFDLRMAPVQGGALILSMDITPQKRVEADLRQAVHALEEADRRKTELLTMLAHELRNPLAPIQNSLHVLRNQSAALHETATQAMDVMDRQVRHLTGLVNDLLDVTRIVREKVTLTPVRLDLAHLVRDTVADYAGVFAERALTLRAELPATPVWVSGDAARLAQALASVLDNACKFTRSGGDVAVAMTVETTSATITVRDTGIGIGRDALPFVFDPLYQADTSLDRAGGGLGLGLTVAKGVVELHRGAIAAESDGADKGTTIRLTIPREPEPAAIEPAPSAKQGARKQRQVLVIEDNPDAGKSLVMVLGLWGYEVGLAASGPEGVDRARALRPDIVLCDIGLPGMDGYAVARALRSDDGTRHAKLIAITGYGREADRAQAIEAGFDLHLAKPVHPDFLKTQLEAA